MLVLTIRTDKPEAELGLFVDTKQDAYEHWQAHRQLAETLHQKLSELLHSHGYTFHDLSAIVVFRGPGSFTGLRIGITVANTLADSLKLQIVGSNGEHWIQDGIQKLKSGRNDHSVLPEYGAPVHITQPRK